MSIIAYIFALLKNTVYGISVFFTQDLTNNVDVMDVLALRFLMSAVVLWLLKCLKIVKINIGVKDFLRKNDRTPYLRTLLLTAIFEPVLYMFFETAGISMTTGITAGVTLSLSPIAVCVAEGLFLKEKTTLLQKIFLGVGIVGVLYIAVNTEANDGKDTFMGIAFLVLAVLSGALFLTFSRKSSKAFSALEITYISSCVGMVVFNAINIARHAVLGTLSAYFAPYFNMSNLIGFVFLAVISTIVATGMNNFALSKIQASTMSAFGGVSTLVTVLVGVLFANETLYDFHLIGIALIVTRMVGVSYIEIRANKRRG